MRERNADLPRDKGRAHCRTNKQWKEKMEEEKGYVKDCQRNLKDCQGNSIHFEVLESTIFPII